MVVYTFVSKFIICDSFGDFEWITFTKKNVAG